MGWCARDSWWCSVDRQKRRSRGDNLRPLPLDPRFNMYSANRRRRPRRASEHEVEPRFAFDPRQKLLVALGRLGDHLFVRLALAGLEPQLRVRADEVTKPPAVAVDNLPNDVADHGGWNGFGERGGEQGAKPPPVRVETVRWRWRRFGEDRRGDDSGLHDGDAHVEGAHLLGEALAQRLEGPFRRGVARHWRANQAARTRGGVDDGSLAPLADAA